MKIIPSSKRHRYVAIVSIVLVAVALVVGMVSWLSAPSYDLTIASTTGGSVTTPGEAGPYTHDEGTVVDLVAVAEEGYYFINWSGDVGSVAYVIAATTTVTMNADYSIMANFEEGVWTFPNPNVIAGIRWDMRGRGYLFPSDVQGHNPFH